MANDEIRRTPDGSIDEIVVQAPDFFHLEQMDKDAWWIGVTKGGKTLHLSLARRKKRVVAVVIDDEIGCLDVVSDAIADL